MHMYRLLLFIVFDSISYDDKYVNSFSAELANV